MLLDSPNFYKNTEGLSNLKLDFKKLMNPPSKKESLLFCISPFESALKLCQLNIKK